MLPVLRAFLPTLVLGLVGPASLAMAANRPCNFAPRDFNGADWDVDLNVVLCSGDYTNIGAFTLREGRTLQIGDGAQVVLRARSARILGTIDGVGAGSAGGAGCVSSSRGSGSGGSGSGPGLGAPSYSSSSGVNSGGGGGGGAGYGAGGGSGGRGGEGPGGGAGAAYGASDSFANLRLGSGGGGSACGSTVSNAYSRGSDGGWGGAALAIHAREIVIPPGGMIDVSGQPGADGAYVDPRRFSGGGGGSGGTLVLAASERYAVSGTLRARGGKGGEGIRSLNLSDYVGGGGGGGAGGRVRIRRPDACGALSSVEISGGLGGASLTPHGTAGAGGGNGSVNCSTLQRAPVISSVQAVPVPSLEGNHVTVTVTATDADDHLLQYQFDCDGDGVYEVGPQTSPSHACFFDDNTIHAVRVRVTDWNASPFTNAGGEVIHQPGTVAMGGSDSGIVDVRVNNVAPSIDLSAPQVLDEAEAGLFFATVTDPSQADTAAGFLMQWSFGDLGGDEAPVLDGFERIRSYGDNGTYTLSVTARDKDGGETTVSRQIVVENVPPTILEVEAPASEQASEPFTVRALATDVSPVDRGVGFTYHFVLTGPNGFLQERTAFGTGLTQTTFTAPTAGAYTLTVTATDKDGGVSEPWSVVIPVAAGVGAPPMISVSPVSQQIDAGQPASFSLSITPGGDYEDDSYQVEWRFGDGSAPVRGTDLTSVAHSYVDQGNYLVNVTVVDAMGQSATRSASVSVLNVPPTAVILSPSFAEEEGRVFTITGAGTDSPVDVTAGLRYLWDFGDGNQREEVNLTEVTHAYEDDGVYEITLVVIDPLQAASDPVSITATIANVPPTAVLEGPTTADEGQVVEFSAVVTDPSAADTAHGFRFEWDFGDGRVVKEMDLSPITHVFGDNGSYTVTLRVFDKDEAFDEQTLTVTVENVPPRVSLGGDRVVSRDYWMTFNPVVHDPGADEGLSYLWTFGDGRVSSQPDPSISYAVLGDFPVRLVVTDKDGGVGQDTILVSVRNQLPVATGVSILPGFPKATDPLQVSYSYADADEDAEGATLIRWYVDDAPMPQFDGLLEVPASATVRGERWRVEVTPHDGFDFGQPVRSEQVVIGNEPPTATNVRISPTAPRRADELVLSYTFTDPDGDPESGTRVRWYRNEQHRAELDDRLAVAAPLTRGDAWRATVEPGDGATQGFMVPSNTVTVGNTPPVIVEAPNVSLPASGAQTQATLSVVAEDVDGDPLTYEWRFAQQTIGTAETVTHAFPVGVNAVTVTVSDGTDSVSRNLTVSIGLAVPTVDLGADRAAPPGEIRLAAAYDDPLNRLPDWSWQVLGSPEHVELNASGGSASFFARAAGVYRVRVTASVGAQSATDEVQVTVLDLAPSAAVWPAFRLIRVGEPVTLDARMSADPNADELSWSWEQVSGPEVRFENDPSEPLVRVSSENPGEVLLRVTVSDGTHSHSADATVRIAPDASVETSPVANVRAPESVLTGEVGRLDGRRSFDLDGDRLSYEWRLVEGDPVTLEDASSPLARFTAETPGTRIFRLVVADATADSYRDVAVEVVDAGGRTRPEAGLEVTRVSGQVGEAVSVEGFSVAGATLRWSQVSGPAVQLQPEGTFVRFVPTVEGTVRLELVAEKDGIFSRPVEAHVLVGDTRPFAEASAVAEGYLLDALLLDGSESLSSAPSSLTYAWHQVDGPSTAVLTGSDTAQALFAPRVDGVYLFELAVSDGLHASEPARVEIRVEGLPVFVGGSCACGSAGPAGLLLLPLVIVLRRRRRS